MIIFRENERFTFKIMTIKVYIRLLQRNCRIGSLAFNVLFNVLFYFLQPDDVSQLSITITNDDFQDALKSTKPSLHQFDIDRYAEM